MQFFEVLSGLVQKVAFQRVDIVQSSDVLVQLDNRMAASDLELARLTRKGLADRLEPSQKLEETKIISRNKIESLRTEVATANAQVARAAKRGFGPLSMAARSDIIAVFEGLCHHLN